MAGSSRRLALEGEEPERMTPAREKTEGLTPAREKTEGLTPAREKTEGLTPAREKTEGLTPAGCCLLESPFQTPIPVPSGYSRSQRLSRSDTS